MPSTITPKIRTKFNERFTAILAKDPSVKKLTKFKEEFAVKNGLSKAQVSALQAWVTIRNK